MKVKKIFTLIFIRQNNEVLLGYKTRGLGVGLWNGFGGKVEENETLLEGAVRELKEECNIKASLELMGTVSNFCENKSVNNVVHIFLGNEFEGEVRASEEMNPVQWFEFDKIPYSQMWPDAKLWLPMLFTNLQKYFLIKVFYNKVPEISHMEFSCFKCFDSLLESL